MRSGRRLRERCAYERMNQPSLIWIPRGTYTPDISHLSLTIGSFGAGSEQYFAKTARAWLQAFVNSIEALLMVAMIEDGMSRLVEMNRSFMSAWLPHLIPRVRALERPAWSKHSSALADTDAIRSV